MKTVVGLAIVAAAAYLVLSPMVVADLLNRPPATTSQMINLRASWGGTLLGIGAFVAWLPALRPWKRTLIGLVAWAMAGIGIARAIGFVLDGDPDSRQYVWITAEAILAIGGMIVLKKFAKAWK